MNALAGPHAGRRRDFFYSDELCQACNDVEGIKLREAEAAALGQLWGNNLHVITAYSYLIVLGFANRAEWQYEKSGNCFRGNKASVFSPYALSAEWSLRHLVAQYDKSTIC